MLFAFLIILIPLASSISTTLLPNYQPGETMIIEIQGNILEPIFPSDILFKRAHVAVAVNYDVKRIGGKSYLYAQVPSTPNNYTLFINNIATTVNGIVTKINYNQTFTVSGNMSEYSISPGFIIEDKDFILTITSNLDQPLTINLDFPQERAVTLQPGANPIKMSIEFVGPGVYLAKIGKYTVPLQIKFINFPQNISDNISISIAPQAFKETLLTNQEKTYNFTIKNSGEFDLNNLYFIFDQTLFDITPSQITSIQSNSSQEFTLSLKRNSGLPLSGEIFLAKDSNILVNLTINITFTNNQSQTTNNTNENRYYCSELGGKFCSATETCSTKPTSSLDGSCCTGVCKANEESSNSWIAYVSILVVLIILFLIYRSYKKAKIPKPKTLSINSILKKP